MFKILTLEEERIWRVFSSADLYPHAQFKLCYVIALFLTKLLLTMVKEAITARHLPLYPQQLSVKYLFRPCYSSLEGLLSSLCIDSHYICYKLALYFAYICKG